MFNNKREAYLDFAKGIGILLIILGHLYNAFQMDSPVKNYVDSFKVIIFFLVSGILFALHEDRYKRMLIKDYIKNKAMSLMIPYFWFSIIACIFDLAFDLRLNTILRDVLSSVLFRGVSTLWFLPSLFFGEILCFLFINQKRSFLGMSLTVGGMGGIGIMYGLEILKLSLPGTVYSVISIPLLTVSHICISYIFLQFGRVLWMIIYRLNFKKLQLAVVGVVMLIVGCLSAGYNRNIDLNFGNLGNFPLVFLVSGTLLGGVLLYC